MCAVRLSLLQMRNAALLTLAHLQLTATAEKLAFLRQVPIFEGSNSRQLTQMHFVLEKCTVQRGHIIILEGQPCAGMFFIVTGQVIVLARAASTAAAPEPDGEAEAEAMPDEAADMQPTRWGRGAGMSWWGLNGRDGQAAGEDKAFNLVMIGLVHSIPRWLPASCMSMRLKVLPRERGIGSCGEDDAWYDACCVIQCLALIVHYA